MWQASLRDVACRSRINQKGSVSRLISARDTHSGDTLKRRQASRAPNRTKIWRHLPTEVVWLLPVREYRIRQLTLTWILLRGHGTNNRGISQSQRYVTTDGQSASLSWCQAPIWGSRPDLYYCQTVASFLMWDALSDERTGLALTIAAGSRQHSHFWVRVPQDSWKYFTVSDSRLPQPRGPCPCIYIPQVQGGQVIAPGTGFPFRRLLRLAGLRWRVSNPPPRQVSRGINCS
jgi:hypothetical protein